MIYPVDSAIQRLNKPGQINHYPVDKYEGNQLHFPVDSDPSDPVDRVIYILNSWGQHYNKLEPLVSDRPL